MALQGSLTDFSAMEILQLLGSQKKSGRLVMEWNTERALVWVTDGRVVSTRAHGMSKDEFMGPRYYRLKVIRGRLENGELDKQLRWIA